MSLVTSTKQVRLDEVTRPPCRLLPIASGDESGALLDARADVTHDASRWRAEISGPMTLLGSSKLPHAWHRRRRRAAGPLLPRRNGFRHEQAGNRRAETLAGVWKQTIELPTACAKFGASSMTYVADLAAELEEEAL
jgi:hypothetical protein